MGSSTDPALIVFAWGNESRGDDGIGPLLARRLLELELPALVVIEDHQLNIEHVTDLTADGAALFIDASIEIKEGHRLERIEPSREGNFSTHAISPQALLNVYEQTMKAPAPDAWLLHVAGRDFGLGAEPGEVALRAIDGAAEFLHSLLSNSPDEWRARLTQEVSGQKTETNAITGA